MTPSALGAILIGGRSRRMGTDKALIELHGKPLVQWVTEALENAGLEVVTAGGPDRMPGITNVSDPAGLVGPLAGLAAALEHAAGRPVLLTAVDQPLLRPVTVRSLLAITGPEVVIPLAAGHPQVTCARYGAGCLPAIARLAAGGGTPTIRHLLGAVAVRYVAPAEWTLWGEDGRSWRSVDTPADLAALADAAGH